MIFIVVKDGIKLIEKQVYAGNDANNRAFIETLRLKNPQLTYEEIADEATFNTKKISPVVTKDQQDWQTAKAAGTNSALAFMAAKLGLE